MEPWDNHNRVVGDTGPYAIRDHAPITASQNRCEKAQIVGWDGVWAMALEIMAKQKPKNINLRKDIKKPRSERAQ